MKTKNEKLHERRKTEILNAAINCFANRGIRQTTMQEICQESKISPGGLYRYFSSKEDIISTIAARESAENDELILFLSDASDPVEALRHALPDIVQEITNPFIARISLEIAAEAARNPEVAKPFLMGEKKFKSNLKKILETAKKSGLTDPDIDIDSFVFLFSNVLNSVCGSYAFKVEISKSSVVEILDKMVAGLLLPKDRSA